MYYEKMTYSISEMFQFGMTFHLIFMGIIFILMIFLLSAIGGRKETVKEIKIAPSSPSIDSNANRQFQSESEVTAAISAAVNEYKKNK